MRLIFSRLMMRFGSLGAKYRRDVQTKIPQNGSNQDGELKRGIFQMVVALCRYISDSILLHRG